jgi:flavin-dependent dehydrogenase
MIYDAVVIGGGPAGSTGAALLAKAGWCVALVEKSRFPRRKVCGEFISATSLPLLDHLGLRSDFLAQAGPEIRRVGFFARDLTLSSPMPRAENSTAGWGRALGRETLDLLLLEAAERAGAKLFQPWKLIAVQKTGGTHLCNLSSEGREMTLEARILVAACGSWERTPFSHSVLEAHKPSDLLAFKAHFHDSGLADDLMPLLVFPGGYGGMVHTDDGRVSLSCCIRRDWLAACRGARPELRAGEAVLAHILQQCAGARDALRGARMEGAWLSAGPIRPGIRRRHDGRCFLAGNIAGEAHPIVAEGISMAMQSAWLLAQALIRVQNIADDPALTRAAESYSRRWKQAFAPRIRAAAVFAQLGMRPDMFAPALPLVERFPQLLSWGARFSGKATQLVRTPLGES